MLRGPRIARPSGTASRPGEGDDRPLARLVVGRERPPDVRKTWAPRCNLCRVGLGTGCEMVARLTECEEFNPSAASRQAMQNLALASRMRAGLARDPRTRGVDLEVVAKGGIVTIAGETRSPDIEGAIDFANLRAPCAFAQR